MKMRVEAENTLSTARKGIKSKKMKIIVILCIVLLCFIACNTNISYPTETITVSGQVTDFEGNPIDSSIISILSEKFEVIKETYSDKNGFYKIEGLKKGHYASLYAMRPKEYPRENAVAEKDMRLEFWAWNIVADTNIIINPRYQKLELYGTTVFEYLGGYKGLFVYFRPMSLTKYISYSKDIYLNKKKTETTTNVSVKPENLKVTVYADDELLKINAIHPIEEFAGKDNIPMTAFLVQVDAPKTKPKRAYMIFRVEAENTEFGEKGENVYFYELKDYLD